MSENIEDYIEINEKIYLLEEKVESLKSKLKYLSDLIRFHKLDDIPLKYKKFNPNNGEYAFFETQDTITTHEISSFGRCHHLLKDKLEFPKDPLEFTKAKERMIERARLYRENQSKQESLEKALDWHFQQGEWNESKPPIHLERILVLAEYEYDESTIQIAHWDFESWCNEEGINLKFSKWMILPKIPKQET